LHGGLLGWHVLGMVFVAGCVLVHRLGDTSGGKVELAQHPVADGTVGKFLRGLPQESLSLGFLAFDHIETDQSRAWVGTLWLDRDGVLELFLGFRQASAGL